MGEWSLPLRTRRTLLSLLEHGSDHFLLGPREWSLSLLEYRRAITFQQGTWENYYFPSWDLGEQLISLLGYGRIIIFPHLTWENDDFSSRDMGEWLPSLLGKLNDYVPSWYMGEQLLSILRHRRTITSPYWDMGEWLFSLLGHRRPITFAYWEMWDRLLSLMRHKRAITFPRRIWESDHFLSRDMRERSLAHLGYGRVITFSPGNMVE